MSAAAFQRGYAHALQFAKFFNLTSTAGVIRARMQYPSSRSDRGLYCAGWNTAALLFADLMPLEDEQLRSARAEWLCHRSIQQE